MENSHIRKFGVSPDGSEVHCVTLQSANNGLQLKIITFGATLVSCQVPCGRPNLPFSDKGGDQVVSYSEVSVLPAKEHVDVVLGFDGMGSFLKEPSSEASQGYGNSPYYIGCSAGRVCNRIGNGNFKTTKKGPDNEDVEENIQLPLNNGEGRHHLHGGFKGFDKVNWNIESIQEDDKGTRATSVTLMYISPHLDQGYPGSICVRARYSLLPPATVLFPHDGFRLEYFAEWSQETGGPFYTRTPVNFTGHSYWNLHGTTNKSSHEPLSSILDHTLTIPNGKYVTLSMKSDDYKPEEVTDFDFTPEAMIPSGDYTSVRETPFDFTSESIDSKGKVIGENLRHLLSPFGLEPALTVAKGRRPAHGGGFDVNYSLIQPSRQEIEAAYSNEYHWSSAEQRSPELVTAAILCEPKTGRTLSVNTSSPGLHLYTGNWLPKEEDAPVIGKCGIKYTQYTGLCLEAQGFPDAPNKDSFPPVWLLRNGGEMKNSFHRIIEHYFSNF